MGPALPGPSSRFGQSAEEGIASPYRSLQTAVPEVLGHKLPESVVLGVRPEVRVEPGEPVGRRASDRDAHNRVVRLEDRKLAQQFFGLPQGILPREQWRTVDHRPCAGGDELDQRLMGDTQRSVLDPGL